MDFDITPYTEIRDSLAQSGINCGVNGRHQIAVSVQDRAIWPEAGNSFWITVATGKWHLFTWSPIGYRIPPEADIPELCRRCMASGNRAMYRVPDYICDEFGLVQLDDDEAEVVYTAMDSAK
ncbi:MAG: hypothetical protein AAGI63_09135 [Planctomycetota bacterium]